MTDTLLDNRGCPPFPRTISPAKPAEQKRGSGYVTITVDHAPHAEKPNRVEAGAITRRLQLAGPTRITFEELGEIILQGGTVCCGTFEPCAGGWGEFLGMQLFMLDFDDPEKLEPIDALERCCKMHLPPAMIYFTFTATTEPWNPKYRLVFDNGEVITDEEKAREFLLNLLKLFPEADKACKNINRLFYGGQELIDCRAGRW